MLRTRLVLAMVLASLAALVVPAVAGTVDEIDERIAEAEQAAADAESRLDALAGDALAARDELVVLEGRLDAAEGNLRRLEGQVALAENELADREAEVAAAVAQLGDATRSLRRVERRLAREESQLADQVATTWMFGSTSGAAAVMELLATSDDPGDLAADLYRLSTVLEGQALLIERVEVLQGDRADAVVLADAARATADQARDLAADAVAHIAGLRDEAAVVEAAAQADRDRQASLLASIEADADGVRALLASVQAERDVLEAERQAELAAQAERNDTGSGDGGPLGNGDAAGTCPVDGAVAGQDFSDDWGDPRPGERRHEGTDIFADRGTPVRALSDGVVKEVRTTDSGLGGRLVSIWVAPGEHWYLAHLDEVAAGLVVGAPVVEGQQLGTVGNSGNARTTPPHLHIGHYVNDVAENPYPVLAPICR